MKDTSVDLGPAFAVTSFTIRGRVVDENGTPVPHICVRVNANGKEGECTNEEGYYELSDMEEKVYMIDVLSSLDSEYRLSTLTIISPSCRSQQSLDLWFLISLSLIILLVDTLKHLF